ncbi:MAG: FHA domain-containing protein [Deltaproteobacteria bacterium]|nr:FHA domain-containing protein [Deltaproteobacteria bacterium]
MSGFRLLIKEGKGSGKEFSFEQPRVRIGRLPENDLVLYDSGVSRNHCEILVDGAVFTLRDTGSANGTLLNDVVTTEARLKHGDHIQIGTVVFVFRSEQPKKGERSGQSFVFQPATPAERRAMEEQKTMAVAGLMPLPPKMPRPRAFSGRMRSLPRSTRLAVVTAAVLVVAGVAASIYLAMSGPRLDRSAELFAADKSNMGLRFGAGKVDVFTQDRVNFQFDYKGGRATLNYAAGGIDSPVEVAILLNGEEIGHIRESPGRWTTGLSLPLPRRSLKPGVNVVTFDNTLTPQMEERWGVAQVRIEQEPLPAVDARRAEDLLKLGRAAFDNRSVAPANLHRAMEYYAEARLYVEGAESPLPLVATIDQAHKAAASELQNLYDTYMFPAEKALRFGDREGAMEALRELLLYLPDQDDPRHKLTKRRLGDLAGQN